MSLLHVQARAAYIWTNSMDKDMCDLKMVEADQPLGSAWLGAGPVFVQVRWENLWRDAGWEKFFTPPTVGDNRKFYLQVAEIAVGRALEDGTQPHSLPGAFCSPPRENIA
jgi:hypothetical protein